MMRVEKVVWGSIASLRGSDRSERISDRSTGGKREEHEPDCEATMAIYTY